MCTMKETHIIQITISPKKYKFYLHYNTRNLFDQRLIKKVQGSLQSPAFLFISYTLHI
jgi:hypothetical protein